MGDQATGNQYVIKRSGTVNYDDPSIGRFFDYQKDAYNQTFNAQSDLNRMLADIKLDYDKSSPIAQAEAYAAKRNADANYAQATFGKAPSSRLWKSRKTGPSKMELFNQHQRAKQLQWRQNNHEMAMQNAKDDAAKELQRIIRSTELDRARIQAGAQTEAAKIQQPLGAQQILEKTRIENPGESAKGMAMNLLGGYANQGSRSNFAYWG